MIRKGESSRVSHHVEETRRPHLLKVDDLPMELLRCYPTSDQRRGMTGLLRGPPGIKMPGGAMECRQTLPWMGREQCGGDLDLEGAWKWSFHAGESSQHLNFNRLCYHPGGRAVTRSAGTQEEDRRPGKHRSSHQLRPHRSWSRTWSFELKFCRDGQGINVELLPKNGAIWWTSTF